MEVDLKIYGPKLLTSLKEKSKPLTPAFLSTPLQSRNHSYSLSSWLLVKKIEIEEHRNVSDTLEGSDLETAQKAYTNASGLIVTEELRKRRAVIT
jgi:hypothetical protein